MPVRATPIWWAGDVGELAGGTAMGVAVSGDLGTALRVPADLLLVATTSFLHEVATDVRAGVEAGLNVITTAEEAAFPWIIDADLAGALDALARDRGVSVIGVGLNPGFIFDALLLTASGIAWDVRAIRIRRVVDVSRFSATIQRRLGIGFTAQRFEEGVDAGSITGHIGFPQSFHLAARCLGVLIDRIESGFEPVIAERPHDGEHLRVEPGTTAGFVQRYRAICDGRPWMAAEFIAHVDPPAAGHEPADSDRDRRLQRPQPRHQSWLPAAARHRRHDRQRDAAAGGGTPRLPDRGRLGAAARPPHDRLLRVRRR